MAARGLLLTLVLVASLCLCPVFADDLVNTTYPLCGDGKPPRKPNVTYTRCLAAKALTCSQDCRDMEIALKIVSANGTTVLNQISQGLGKILGGKDLRVCALLAGHDECSFKIEQILCAMCCNPDQRNYLTKTGVLSLCSSFASDAYTACKDVDLPGFGSIGKFFPTKEELFTTLVAAFVSRSTFSDAGDFKAKIIDGTNGCFNGPQVYPTTTACCDSLDVPGACFPTIIDTAKHPEYIPFMNQTNLPTTCNIGSAPSSAPPNSSPAPPSSSPTQPKSGGARLVAPVVLIALSFLANVQLM